MPLAWLALTVQLVSDRVLFSQSIPPPRAVPEELTWLLLMVELVIVAVPPVVLMPPPADVAWLDPRRHHELPANGFYDSDALDVAAMLEILGVDERNAVFLGRRPDQRVPKRETVAWNCVQGPKRDRAGQR